MKIATYTVNGINGRLSVLRWLETPAAHVFIVEEIGAKRPRQTAFALRS